MRLGDAEMNALKNGKKAAAKMESRIKELEAELDSEQRRMADAVKNLRKSERKIKEMEFQGGLIFQALGWSLNWSNKDCCRKNE